MRQVHRQLAHHRLIVVDDASPVPYTNVEDATLIRRERNGGFGSSVNTAARVATGDLLLVLNSDLSIADDFVTLMLDAHERFPMAVLSPQVNDATGEPVAVGRRFPRTRHHVVEWLSPLARWRRTTLWQRGVGHAVHTEMTDTEVDWVMGAAMLIPLTQFRQVGGFDERFYMNSEEVDLQRRLRAVGVRAVALGAPSVTHEGGGSTPSHRRREWVTTSRLTYAAKWGSPSLLQAALGSATLVNFIVNVVRKALGRDLDPWRTARDEIRLLRRQK